MFSFPRIPEGWFACDGSLKSIAEYQVLYTLLGTTYGGDGTTTFGVPDLRGQVPMHQGTGQSLSPRVMGQAAGSESVTLLSAQMPQHMHQLVATSNAASTATPSQTVMHGAVSGDTTYLTNLTGSTPVPLALNAITPQGGNQPHNNLMPTLTVSFCIAWAGIYPSPS
jgi:microcystin-dependent protein